MNEITNKSSSSREVFSSAWSLWLWAVAALLTVLIFAVMGTAWVVRHVMIGQNLRLSSSQSRFVMTLAEFPGVVRVAANELRSRFDDDPVALLVNRKATEKPHWVRRFPASDDPGYLLFSGVDPVAKHVIVKLIRISDGVMVGHWDPDWLAIYKKIKLKEINMGGWARAQAGNPLLLSNGDIIFNTGDAMVRLNSCSADPVWVLDEVMHHSNELDQNGDIWAPSLSEDGLAENAWLRQRVRDDALARVSPYGRVLEMRSFSRILRDNGLQALLLGTSGFNLNEDPIHLNQIQVAQLNSRYWQRGDLLISARHLSTVFLYRPSTGKIFWHQTGPWMNQHSVDFVGDHRISVFDNNNISAAPSEFAFMLPSDTNRVILYDFDTSQVSQPFAAQIAEARPVTLTGGRARVLPDGGLFIEETNYGRHLRFTRDRLLWSRVNDYDYQRIGVVSGSRYLTADEAHGPLQALAARKCSAVAVQ